MTDSRYPEIPDSEQEPPSNIVRELAKWDAPHSAKAAIIARMAGKEFQFAKEDEEKGMEEYDEDEFSRFVDDAFEIIDEHLS